MAGACALAGGPAVFSAVATGVPEEESLRASRPRAGEAGGGGGSLGPAGPGPGTAAGQGPVPSGACARRSAEIRPPGKAQHGNKQHGPPSSPGPRPSGHRGRRGLPRSQAPAGARTREGAAAGGRGTARLGAGARSAGVRAPAPRPLSLPGQCSFPRAREASQEVEVFPKAVAARRCPTRGRRGRRPRFLLLLLLEAQPPKGFKKTLLHGVGAGRESPGFPFLKSRSWPKLLFLWLSGHVIDGGAGARSPAPPSHPSEPRCVGGGVPTWKAGDAGRLAAGRTWGTLPTPDPRPALRPPPLPLGALRPEGRGPALWDTEILPRAARHGSQALCNSPPPPHPRLA